MQKNDDGRLAGVVLIIISSLGACWTVGLPLFNMLNRKEYISYSTNGVVITSLGLLFGLLLSIFGRERLDGILGKPDNKGALFRPVLLLIFVAIFIFSVIYVWNTLVSLLGYS
ncbi:MAG: hypothetical protein JNK32_14405 [Anaerolineales bacterium]|nr:hypothetical protein [Anaerolineales bacterium]